MYLRAESLLLRIYSKPTTMFKKILSIALLICALCACKKTPIDDVIPVASVSLNQTEAEMLVGETLQLQAQISPSNATDKTIMWGSSKQSVATVSEAGLVTAVGEGTAKITVTASGKTATCEVTVTKSDTPVDPVHVESVSLDKETAALEIGETLALSVTVLPANADDKSVAWKSTNTEIAEVDQNGNVTAISSGTVTITVTTVDGEKVASCEITVTEVFIPVESVTFEHTDLIVFQGDSYQINVTVLPENATNKTITWASSDPAVASISQEGIITGLGGGLVKITAKAGDIVATCDVMAIAIADECDGVENGHYWVDMGLPSGIKWATCNVGADNSAQTGSLFAWGEVSAKDSESNPPYSFKNFTTGKYLKYVTESRFGDIDNLFVLEPQDDAAHVQWGGDWRMPSQADVQELIDNTTYEPIQQYGKWGARLTSKNNGHSIFILTDSNKNGDYFTSSLVKASSNCATGIILREGGIRFSNFSREIICPIRAVVGTSSYVPVESLESDESDITIVAGQTRTLSVRVLPENATYKTVIWTSDDESVAVVDEDGNMTAVGKGYTYIRAIAGGKKYSFYVKVIPVLENLSIDPVDMTLLIGETASVTVTVSPGDLFDYYYYQSGYSVAEYKVLRLTNVSDDYHGKITFNITAIASGEAKLVYHIVVDGEPVAVTCHVTVPYVDDDYDGETDGHKWVDLGLPSGIKWATSNIGTDYSTQVGPLLKWGEGENDPVKVNWGGDWRMPTEADAQELRDNTTYEWISYYGVPGAKFTSKINGKSIFLAADERYYGIYLTSSNDNGNVTCINFLDDGGLGINSVWQDNKHPIRPVIDNPPYVPVASVDFGYSHEFLSVGDVRYLDVDISPSNATKKKVTWSSDDESVAVVDSHGKLSCVGVGRALIYAEADGKKDFFILRVDPHINSITIEPSELNLTVGQTATITVRIDPDVPLGSSGLSTWGGVFDIQQVGDNPITYRITALEEGTGSFTFHAYGVEATCTVTVTNP